MDSLKIDRLCMNFMDTCNMKCPYCYIPFIKEKVDFTETRKILEKAKRIGIKIITFGGGDPYNYNQFKEIIDIAYDLEIKVHVDTNCINLKESHYSQINDKVSLIALPIDASSIELHDIIRNYKSGHLQIVLKHLRGIQELNVTRKINTVVCKYNLNDIENIQNLLQDYKIDVWSLYQFWPLHNSSFYKKEFELSQNEYIDSITGLKEEKYKIERNTYDSRAHTYLFSSPNGKLYTHDPANKYQYKFIGNFLDDDWEEDWKRNCQTSIRINILSRYK